MVVVRRQYFPLTKPVTRIRRDLSGTDELNNDITVESRDEVLVFAYYTLSPDEPVVSRHERLELDARLIAGVGDFIADDAVVLPGLGDKEFEVIGEAENYEANPWWSPGVETVNLRRVQR